MLLQDIFWSVLLSQCVKSVSPTASDVPRELCAHDVLHKHTHIHALCMCSHSSKAAIVTAYFRLEWHKSNTHNNSTHAELYYKMHTHTESMELSCYVAFVSDVANLFSQDFS